MTVRDERKRVAREFAEYWAGQPGSEDREDQKFWNQLLREVLGVDGVESFIDYQQHVKVGLRTKRLDAWIPSTRVLIEQKSRGVDLNAPQAGHGGKTPYEQAKEYDDNRPLSQKARWIVTCNFETFQVHDMESPNPERCPEIIKTSDLEREHWRLSFLIDDSSVHIHREEALSVEAGEIIAKIHRRLKSRFVDPESDRSRRSLNILCMRIVFCLFAEDAGLFGGHSSFGDYIASFPVGAVRGALRELFGILDTPERDRDPYLGAVLRKFPYVDGGLFHDQDVEIPSFDQETKDLIVHEASEGFDWSEISPTIFGALFDSTLAPRERASGAMHYTSVGNIGKVIGPLFLSEAKSRLEEALAVGDISERVRRLEGYLDYLGGLSFFDPACGSGNFLTETYLSLRRLENRALEALVRLHADPDAASLPHVKLESFHGIEINEFACSVARASLWIAECQETLRTRELVRHGPECFPLRVSANIVCGNALKVDWRAVHVPDVNTYLFGNPPFAGGKRMTPAQRADLNRVFSGVGHAGTLDYVAAWFERAVSYLRGGRCRAAFVATNSIAQGEQPGILFDHLFGLGMVIDFAWRPFKWESESRGDPAVTCVIIGFHVGEAGSRRVIYDAAGVPHEARNINAYLVDGPDISVKSSRRLLCDVPPAGIGNKPIDDGNYLFTAEEKRAFLRKEPRAARFFMEWAGADELIYGYRRHCLFLRDATPSDIRSMAEVRRRVANVVKFRRGSPAAQTRKLADSPLRFHVTNLPEGRYLVIPEVSSENRDYIPMAFLDERTLCSNLLKVVPGATEYHFGVLTSSVHMAWTRAVCGRREMRYRYSTGVVYNNFPWPAPDRAEMRKIERTAARILQVRARHAGANLDALYDPVAMPVDLRQAHRMNDLAVMEAYGFDPNLSEAELVGALLEMYRELLTVSRRRA